MRASLFPFLKGSRVEMVLQPSEDLFEDTRMTFGEHLEELRKTLVKSLIGLAIGCAIGMFFADEVVKYLQTPLETAIQSFLKSQAEERLAAANDGIVPPELQPLLDEDGLLPRKLKVDSQQLALVLQDSFPDLPQLDTIDRHAFRPSQIPLEQVTEVAKLFLEPGEDPARRWLSEHLSDTERDELKAIQGKPDGTVEDRQQLLAILDRLAQLEDLYRQPEFDGAYLGIKKSSWLSGLATLMEGDERPNPLARMKDELIEKDSPEKRRRLQRLLISRSLAPAVASVRTEVIDLEVWEATKLNPQALKVEEVFMVWLKAGLISGIVLSSPWIFYQVWLFIAAGLYPHERRYVHVYLPLSIVLFLSGVLLAFFGVFQPVLMFLFQFNASMGIDPQPRIGEWLTFVMILPLGFGIAFQLPLVMLFINRIGLVPIEAYIEKWRIAILVIFVVAMILTPADPISMLMLAVPLTFLYFLGILLAKWMPRNKNPFQESYEP